MATYLALAFGLAWTPFICVPFGGSPHGVLLMPVAPALACLAVRHWVTQEGSAELRLRPSLRSLSRRWPVFLVAVTWPLLATPLGVLLGSGAQPSVRPITLLGWLVLSVAVAPTILGEELGWRGYLQMRLCPGQPVRAAILTGLLWAIWHYPLLLTESVALLSLTQFTTGIVTKSIFLGWLHTRSGTVWAPSIGHASNNVTEDNLSNEVFAGRPPSGGTGGAVLLAEAIVLMGVILLDSFRARATTNRTSARPQHRLEG